MNGNIFANYHMNLFMVFLQLPKNFCECCCLVFQCIHSFYDRIYKLFQRCWWLSKYSVFIQIGHLSVGCRSDLMLSNVLIHYVDILHE